MSYLEETLAKHPPIRKKGIVSYSSKFFAAFTIATLATLSYCITDGIFANAIANPSKISQILKK